MWSSILKLIFANVAIRLYKYEHKNMTYNIECEIAYALKLQCIITDCIINLRSGA